MKIRIGNDIKLRLQLKGVGDEAINIISIRAYIINVSEQNKLLEDLKSKTKFIGRFPTEPISPWYTPSKFNINSSGYFSYNVHPHACIYTTYNGFGVTPDWGKIYPSAKDVAPFKYESVVQATDSRDTVEVFFPAQFQSKVGIYKVVLVVKLYDPSFIKNTRTVCIDYNNAFELVSNSEDATDNSVTIVVPSGEDTFTGDKYIYNASFDNGNIQLHRTDYQTVDIDISNEVLWGGDLYQQ